MSAQMRKMSVRGSGFLWCFVFRTPCIREDMRCFLPFSMVSSLYWLMVACFKTSLDQRWEDCRCWWVEGSTRESLGIWGWAEVGSTCWHWRPVIRWTSVNPVWCRTQIHTFALVFVADQNPSHLKDYTFSALFHYVVIVCFEVQASCLHPKNGSESQRSHSVNHVHLCLRCGYLSMWNRMMSIIIHDFWWKLNYFFHFMFINYSMAHPLFRFIFQTFFSSEFAAST